MIRTVAKMVICAAALTGCTPTDFAPSTPTQPAAIAAPPVVPVTRPAPTGPSAASITLRNHYANVQRTRLARGLMRTDGGGVDTVFTDTMLARNFERIALRDEYERGGGLKPASNDAGAIKKWTKPVRLAAEFGPSVSAADQAWFRKEIGSYTARLARVSGHPMTVTTQAPNFHVLVMSEDDKALIAPRIREIVPNVNPTALRIFDRLPRGIHCLVLAFSDTPGGYDYGTAIAVIRAEHPELQRRACIHEEVAQGMGLTNDDPQVRPSIFNDDDEFALLTRHDEMLLKILYDPRLTPGMGLDQARPIAAERASQLVGSRS